MASNLGIQGSDAVPHQFPPSMTHTHIWHNGVLGKMSSMEDACTKYTSGMDELELSQLTEIMDNEDNDIVPYAHPPTSFLQWRSVHTPELCAPDPDLGLTPEKRVIFPRSNFRNDATVVKEKTGRRVRFDVESSSESELEKSLSTNCKTKSGFKSGELPSDPQTGTLNGLKDSDHIKKLTDNSQSQSQPKGYAYAVKHAPDSCSEQVEVIDIESTVFAADRKRKNVKLKCAQERPPRKNMDSNIRDNACDNSAITKEQEATPIITEYKFPFKSDAECKTDIFLSSAFERPEYNSTLHVGNELKDLASRKLDVAKAVKKTLRESEILRTDINEKAASRVNTPGDIFKGLTPLEVPVDDIISQVEQREKAKVKSSGAKSKKDVTLKEIQEPDLMEFFTPDLQKEVVDLSVTGVTFPKELLSLASHKKAFDMYKRNLAWEEFDQH